MPAPDPFGIELSDEDPRTVLFHTWMCGNRKHRRRRAAQINKNLRTPFGWACPVCGEPVPLQRRADAVYCRPSCKKKAKRLRGPVV
ncbi:hypothetical protein C8J30_102329 [Rhodobacter viridis]|uniref:Uncharacterized protein n=1 Tax=Rhodobacter viridis TaxID=1054202 RepID=A0A318U1Q1_9RHOB|nr:hypothetical protein [Rhodobacter viridis]PYF12014.1 hypothetical protein C8J30_102329 [Rhodobacter viridis]